LKHSVQWIMTEWHGEQWDFQNDQNNNGTFWSLDNDWMAWRTVRFSKQWKDNGAFRLLHHDWMTWRTMEFSKQWNDNETYWSLYHEWMAWRTGDSGIIKGQKKQWNILITGSWLDRTVISDFHLIVRHKKTTSITEKLLLRTFFHSI
jgi:hypothetical protein